MDEQSLDYIIEYSMVELDEINSAFHEYNYDYNTMFTEASNKPPIHKRLLDLIKRIIHSIRDFFVNLFNKIKSFYQSFKMRKQNPKTMNQILSECGILPKRKVHQEAAVVEKEKVVHFYATKDSEFKECDLKILSNHLLLKIKNDDFVVKSPGIEPGLILKGPSRTSDWKVQYCITAALLTQSEFENAIYDIMELLSYDKSRNELVSIDSRFISEIQKLINKLYNKSLLDKLSNSEITWHRHDLVRFQKEINDASSVIEKVQSIQGIDQNNLHALNDFADLLLIITIGMNEFNRAIDHMYMIDTSYIGSIDDAISLDKFIHYCVKDGIPAKFVAYNTWLLLNKTWCMNEKIFYTSKIQPKWGQTRTVFDLKDDEVVAKIGMSGIGIRCNRNEVVITNEYKKCGAEDVIASVVKAMPYCALIFPQKIESHWKMNNDDVCELKNKLYDLYWDYPKLHDIRNDIHVNNIGKINNNIVCIDYGGIDITEKVK